MTWYISMMLQICFLVAVFMMSPVTGRDSDNVAREVPVESLFAEILHNVQRRQANTSQPLTACNQSAVDPSRDQDPAYDVPAYRFHALIYGNTTLLCGGAVLNKDWLITSASCLQRLTGTISLVLGYQQLASRVGEQNFFVSNIVYNPKYNAYACEQTPINPSTVSWDVPYTVEQFRYHVVIYGDTPLVCAGAIYLNTIVITSASCARQLEGVVILLGGYRPLPYTEGEQFHISVTYVPHSYYKPELGNTFDIAFFITSVEGRKVRFEYTNRVQPICVPRVSCQPIPRSANLTMSGLVYVDNSEPVLQLYPLVLVNRRICSKWRIGFKVAGHMLCATKLNGGSCEGFLGGPVIYKSEGNYLLAGVVSSCHSGDRVIITSINALYCPSPD